MSMTDQEAQIIVLKRDADLLLAKAGEVGQIENAEHEARAVEFVSQVKRRMKIADEARTKLVKPLNDHVKMINAEFKKTTEPLEEAEAIVKKGMIDFRQREDIREAEERRKALEIEARQAVRAGDINGLQEIAADHAEASAIAPRTVNTETGRAHYRKVWRFEVESINLIPYAYLIPDEAKIRESLNNEVSIPGVRAWQESVPYIS